VRIYATRKIRPGDEIYIDYGEDFWSEIQKVQRESSVQSTKIPATTTSTKSSLWAAPAPIPTLSHTSVDSDKWAAPAPSLDHPLPPTPKMTPTPPKHTMIWPIQVPAPSSPTILGHSNPTQHTDQTVTQSNILFPPHLSPIKLGPSPNYNLYMNETFSLNQMYELNDTLLLPKNITNPNI